jgi:hypothetical protein
VVRECGRCGGAVEERYRFCPWCAAPQRLKVTEVFRGASGLLRVSRYYEAPDRSAQVRLSTWSEDGEARAVVSLEDAEAERLGAFIRNTAPPTATGIRSLLGRLRQD